MLNPANTLATTFDSGSTVVNDNNGNPWLKIVIISLTTTYSSIVIVDLNTLSTITIEQYGGSGLNLYNFYVSAFFHLNLILY